MQLFRIPTVLAVGAAMAVGAAAASPARAEIVVDSWWLANQVRDTLGPTVDVEHLTPTFPFNQVDTATDGPTYAQATYDFAKGDDWASFDFLFDQSRSGSDSFASSFGIIRFTLTEPLQYALQGSHALSGAGRIFLFADLRDLSQYPASGNLYRGEHESEATPNESFTLGVAGGDLVSSEFGELTGTLMPGTPYQVQYGFSISNNPFVSGSAATADGMLSFTLTPAPEPGALALVAAGGLALLRRRR